MMPRGMSVVLATLSLSGFLLANEDPWALPKPVGVKLMMVIAASERAYGFVLASEVPEDAGGPERVEPKVPDHERRILARCRKTIAERKYEEAEKILGNLSRRSRANHDATALRALCLARMGKPEPALANLRKSIIGNRRNPEAWKLLEELAAAGGKKVVRPELAPRGWTRPEKDGEVEIGYADADKIEDFPWTFYGAARAYYRYEGEFGRVFPKEKKYRYTFREQLFALGALIESARAKKVVGPELARLLTERKAGTLVPFAFFALYAEPVPAKPERDFKDLLPVLEKYFDEHVLVTP